MYQWRGRAGLTKIPLTPETHSVATRFLDRILGGKQGPCSKAALSSVCFGKRISQLHHSAAEYVTKLKHMKGKLGENLYCLSELLCPYFQSSFFFPPQPFLCLLYLIKAENCLVHSGLLVFFSKQSSTINATLLLQFIYLTHETRIIFTSNKPGLLVQDSQTVIYKYSLQLLLAWAQVP